MGAIQSSINQAINLGTALYTQTGAYEEKKKIKALESETKALEETAEGFKAAKEKNLAKIVKVAFPGQAGQYEEKLADVYHELTEKYAKLGKASESSMSLYDELYYREQAADVKAQLQKKLKKEQEDAYKARINEAKNRYMGLLKEER